MLKMLLRSFFRSVSSIQRWAEDNQTNEFREIARKNSLTRGSERLTPLTTTNRYRVVNLWDHLTFKEGTQAHHITKVLDYEEWVSMEEILRRVNELFGITYQNERSLYPYLKTLVDSGLLEANMVGGKMKWRKKNLIVSVKELIEEEIEAESTMKPTQ
ncbi:MAG: hypothetical protein V1776_00195 [Candidatus Diapherotrites archaeon]